MRVPPGRILLVLACQATLAAAGCVGEPHGTATTPDASSSPACTPVDQSCGGATSPWTDAPKPWAVGDWWNFTATAGSRGSFTHVVARDDGDHWAMETDNANSAFRNAVSDTSYLGPVRKADLAGSQGELRIQYLVWPLTEGARWATTWDGEAILLDGRFIPGPAAASPPSYYVQARRENGTLYAEYAYGPAVGWFLNATFYDTRGKAEFGFALAASGHGYSSTIARWDLRKVVDWRGAFGGQATNWAVPANATDVYAQWRFTCTTGAVLASFGRLVLADAVAGHTTQGQCPLDDRGAQPVGVPAPGPAGDEHWGAAVTAAPGTVGDFELQVWVRTLTRAPLRAP